MRIGPLGGFDPGDGIANRIDEPDIGDVLGNASRNSLKAREFRVGVRRLANHHSFGVGQCELLPVPVDPPAPIRFLDKELRRFVLRHEDLRMGTKSYGRAAGDWVVTHPDHWIYEGTDLAKDDRIPGLIGWEYHGTPADIPGLEVVAATELYPRSHRTNPEQNHAAVVFPCARGNWVFNAGTIWWSEGLSSPPGHIPARTGRSGPLGVSEHVQRITRNILNRMIEDSPR